VCSPLWARGTQSLGPWRFRLDPQRVGIDQQWFATPLAEARSIRVPGCWDAQGFGDPTSLVKHNFVGWGWYEATDEPGKRLGDRLFLCFGAVHRSAKVWVNGALVGEHLGYVTAFEFDITNAYDRFEENRITVLVDSEQHVETDGLAGCYDTYDFIKWGGLYRDAHLEWRSETRLDNLFVRAEQGCTQARVTADVVGPRAGAMSARCALRSASGTQQFIGAADLAPNGRVDLVIPTPNAALWSPNHPNLYRATLELLKDGVAIDAVSTTCGLREIEIRGNDIYLNGKRVFLRGYGDDACFPETVCPPASVEYWRQRFRKAREYGFTYVRHHSHVPIREYFAAADQLGFLIQPELPIAYEPHIVNATPAALDLFRSQWRDIILQYRNHPSVMTWCMGNEMGNSNVLAKELYATAKQLDPTRPVCDSDGLWGAWDNPPNLRDTLDLIHLQFDENSIPWGDRREKYELAGSPKKPVTVHEMSNFVAFYDVRDAAKYRGLVKPAWLTGQAAPEPETYPSYRDARTRMWYVRQQGPPWKVEWETRPVLGQHADRIAFVWTAATGFLTEPSGSFTLSLNGNPLITFNCTEEKRPIWRSDDGRSELIFDVKQLGIDQFGVMYLVVPADLAPHDQPARLKVTGSASDSRRWFGIYDYHNTISHEERAGTLLDLGGAKLVEGLNRLPRWTKGDAGSVLGIANLRGTVDLLPTFVENSRKLQALCLKLNIEAARRSREIDGYAQWLLIDYWQGGQGVLNQFHEPKGLTAEQFRRFNDETVVLLDRDRCTVTVGDTIRAQAVVSHFGEEPLATPTLQARLLDPWQTVVAAQEWDNLPPIPAGAVSDLAPLELTAQPVPTPTKLTLELTLRDGARAWTNAWDYWVFPQPVPWEQPERVAFVEDDALAKLCPGARQVRLSDLPTEGVGLLVATKLTDPLLQRLAEGQRVLLLGSSSVPGDALQFKSPWWFPGPQDSNLGTIVRNHPALGSFPHEGWCDLDWFDMVQGSRAVVHDGALASVQPIIQAIDLPLRQQTRSLLFEARVSEGRLLVCTLNISPDAITRDPAARWLFDGLVRYARSNQFQPVAQLTPGDVAVLRVAS